MEEIKCYGCGAVIQNDDEKKIGFVPKAAMDKDYILCRRCFQLNHYHQIQESHLSDDDFLQILQKVGDDHCLVVYMIDLFDINGSVIQGLSRHVNNNDIIVVGNKRDVLPKAINDTKINHWLRRFLKSEGIKAKDVVLVSGKKNYNLDLLMDTIEKYRNGRNVYIVGTTNVGKSSLVNAILKSFSSEHSNFITTSEFPGTTLDMIEIPFDETTCLYDTPGIINRHQIAHMIDPQDLKKIIPQSELRPVNYQLSDKQTLYVSGLARFDFIKGNKSPVTCYFNKGLKIHRTKLEKADELYDRHKTLDIELDNIKTTKDFKTYQFRLPENKVDIVISGLGFFTMKCPQGLVEVKAPENVGVFIRDALI